MAARAVPSAPDAESSHQWLRDGAAIVGATASSYLLRSEDIGHRVSVRVTGTAYWHTPGTVVSSSLLVGIGEAPTAFRRPSISGNAAPGGTVSTAPGQWDTDGVTTSRQWYADGRRIPGATGTALALGWQHAGARLTVVETATRSGFASGTSTSSVTRVARAATAVSVALVKKGRGLRVQVRTPAILTALGRLSLLDGNRIIDRVELIRGHRGVYVFDLSDLKRGKHTLSGSFAGNEQLVGARSAAVTLRVR